MSNNLHSDTRSFATPMLFAALPVELQHLLRSGAHMRKVASGQLIQQRGETASGFYLIESGSVAVGQYMPDGEFRAVGVLGPGDSWGELALFAGRPRVVDAVARSAADLMFIQKDQFEAALSDHPGAMRDVLGALSAQLQELLNITAGMRSGSAKARLAGLLVTLAGDKPLPVKLTLTQQELGELLGLTRATINAALGDFEHRALVQRSYGRLDVLDLDGLRLAALGPE